MHPFILLLLIGGVFMAVKLTMGQSGRDLIKKLEGYSNTIYDDSAGIPTIGWGHRVLPKEMGAFQNGITTQQAEDLLTQDMQYAVNAVNYYVTVPITQTQFDALVSFVYNVGASAFANSTLLRKLNQKDYGTIPVEMKRWKYITVDGKKIVSKGLINRRENEAQLFIS